MNIALDKDPYRRGQKLVNAGDVNRKLPQPSLSLRRQTQGSPELAMPAPRNSSGKAPKGIPAICQVEAVLKPMSVYLFPRSAVDVLAATAQ